MSDLVLLLAHPRPHSFCHALADRIATRLLDLGHTVWSHDLHAELFDPLSSPAEALTNGPDLERVLAQEPDPVVQRHREELRRADGLVVVHPNWWGMPPAVLVGWLDRVVVPGVAYRLEEGHGLPERLAPLRHLVVVNTSDTPPEREQERYGDPLATIWGRCVAPYLGDPAVTRTVLGPVAPADERQRGRWLDEAAALAATAIGPAT